MFHVKHLSKEMAKVQSYAQEVWPAGYSRSVEDSQLSLILRHLDFILSKAKVVNLTAITDRSEAIRLHVVDSLAGLPEVEQGPGGSLLDLGSGAGYPGLPLALATDRSTLLLDSVGKKVAVLQKTIEVCGVGLQVSARHDRAEQLSPQLDGSFAVVVARAVTALPALLELASPLLQDQGVLIAWRGPDVSEANSALLAARITGMEAVGIREYRLPVGNEGRSLHTYRKVSKPEIELPRRTGVAQRKPLR